MTKQAEFDFSHLRAVDDSYLIVTALRAELPQQLPERILFDYVPGWEEFRAPGRFIILTHLS